MSSFLRGGKEMSLTWSLESSQKLMQVFVSTASFSRPSSLFDLAFNNAFHAN